MNILQGQNKENSTLPGENCCTKMQVKDVMCIALPERGRGRGITQRYFLPSNLINAVAGRKNVITHTCFPSESFHS